MSDHHIDTMDIDYSKAAEHILKRHGLYISGAPPINHKPGNDFISDVYWPFPTYPDNRFRDPYQENLDIKYPPDPPDNDPPASNIWSDEGKDFQIIPEELKQIRNLKNPIITFNVEDTESFIDRAVYPYTGLTLQAVEKKAFDISFVKPYYQDGERKTKLIRKEVITGHFMSIATYDGWKYHIYRGLCRDILKTKPVTRNGKRLYAKSVPFGNPVQEVDLRRSDVQELISKNLHIILDVSTDQHAELVSIPVGQIIDIQEYNFIYNFTIYEGKFKVFWDDWYTVEAPDSTIDNIKYYTYVPFDSDIPQNLYHEVIEHQKPCRKKK